MTKEIEKVKTQELEPKYKFAKIEQFGTFVNRQPKSEEIKVNKYAGNSKYLPISFIETTLDELFMMDWTTENFQYQVVANELIGSLELVFTHPISGRVIRRVGAAAVPIQMKKGSDVSQFENKIHNTLVKDFPHLKASCLANAARSIGKLFGRDLNRKDNDTYQPMFLGGVQKEASSVSDKIEKCKNLEVLETIFQENQDAILASTELIGKYKSKKKSFNKKTKTPIKKAN